MSEGRRDVKLPAPVRLLGRAAAWMDSAESRVRRRTRNRVRPHILKALHPIADRQHGDRRVRIITLLGIAAFTAASAVIAVRLLWLWRRTRQAPELAMGVAFAASGALGYPLVVASSMVDATGRSEQAHLLASIALCLLSVGTLALASGNWKIYRPSSRLAGASLWALAAVLCAAIAAHVGAGDVAQRETREIAFWTCLLSGSGVFAWGAAEAFSLHRALGRRARIGLASREVVNRVLLWGIGACASCAMPLHGLAVRLLQGPSMSSSQQLVASLLGLVVATAIWLAFFPPAAYRARFGAPAPTEAG